jgi:membrane associated rhomboid family serine protease
MIPINTDAPIYHYPIATVTMIVVNVLFFLAFCLHSDIDYARFYDEDGQEIPSWKVEREFERIARTSKEEAYQYLESLEVDWGMSPQAMLSLEFGKIRPWQWLTNNFMHANWEHLIGNMIFLWAFGLLVEGKTGAAVFTAIYLGMGTFYGMLLQLGSLPFLDSGGALGASAVIFALLALCIIWAPANEFTIFAFRFIFDMPILLYGGLFVMKEVAFWALSGFELDSELLHILGFGVGVPVGIYLVKSGRVDCEGWDIFSYLGGSTGEDSKVAKDAARKQAARERKNSSTSPRTTPKDPAAVAPSPNTSSLQDQVTEAIGVGQFLTALRLQEQLMKSNPSLKWRQADLYAVIGGMLKANELELADRLIEQHIMLFAEKQTPLNFTLCKVKLALGRPHAAREVLNGMNEAFLNEKEREQYTTLSAAVAAKNA